jgi:outer membrane protein assembly factor BamB
MRRVLLVLLIVLVCSGADWPRFRGPGAVGVDPSDATGPTVWTETENVLWKTPVTGFGSSSPVMIDGKLFVTGYDGYGNDRDEPGDMAELRYKLACYDAADGSLIWERAIIPFRSPKTPYERMSLLHGYASPTPVVDENAVYVSFGNSGVYAATHDGDRLWHADVGELTHGWNCGASPILWNDLVIVNASIESKSIIALNKTTGERIWTAPEIESSWATPLIVETEDGDEELVVSMKNILKGYDPATGEELWRCDSVEDYVCPGLICRDGIVYVTGGRGPFFAAVKTGGRGDVTETHTIWTADITPKVSTPLLYGDYLYFIDQQAIAVCLDARNGETVYRERLDLSGSGDKVYSSMVQIGEKLYCFSRVDGCVVLPAEPEFELLAKNYLGDDSVFNATPIVDDGRLITRSDKFLYCLGTE